MRARPRRVLRAAQFGPEVMVRHLIGLDTARRGVAIADSPELGTRLAFCERHVQAARADLMRVCAEIREELEPEAISVEAAALLGAAELDQAAAAHRAQRIMGAVYRELLRARRAAFWRAQRRAANRAPCAGRCALGGVLRRW